jgi:RecA-family ATPase
MIDEGPPDPLTPGDHGEYTVKHYPPKTTKKNGGKPAEILSPWTGATLNGKSRQEETNSKTEQEEAPPTSLGEWDAGDDTEAPPPRAWLLGNIFCRMFLSSLLVDGGVGKTAARIAQLLSLAIRRSLTGEHVFQRCRVLIVSLEDNRDELKRRILAACLHHGIQPSELKGWLFLATPGADGGKLMTIDRNGRLLRGDMAAKLEATIKAREIDIVSLDPFVKDTQYRRTITA